MRVRDLLHRLLDFDLDETIMLTMPIVDNEPDMDFVVDVVDWNGPVIISREWRKNQYDISKKAAKARLKIVK